MITVAFGLSSCDLSPVPEENEEQPLSDQATIDPLTATQKTDTPPSEPKMMDQSPIILTPTGPDKENDRLTVELTGSTAIIDVASPTGIGRAEITTTTGLWPQKLIFRFHLQALEGFQISNGAHRYDFSLKPEENAARFEQAQAGQKLDPIEVEVPSSWLKDAPGSLNIQWVDWYR
jgi:hypothetical protein